jgi:thiamine-phosphate pyrophosphorylase
MKLILISSPVAIADEPTLINELFAAGLEIFHLRKPAVPAAEVEKLLARIKPVYYPRIALHQHHNLAEQFGINRFHFPEQEQQQQSASAWPGLRAAGYTLSTSVHQPETLKKLPPVFSYVFLSTVFTSISKPGYTSVFVGNFYLPEEEKNNPVIALGGITQTHIRQVREMNFDGAAVLGAIWQEPDSALENFKNLQNACSQTALTY